MYEVIRPLEAVCSELDAFSGYCIAYFRHEVLVGLWKDGAPGFVHAPDWSKATEIHIFNAQKEYRAVRTSDGCFRLRVRNDGEREENVFDEHALIIGSKSTPVEEAAFFEAEERGRRVCLPSELSGKSVILRSYLSFEAPDEEHIPGCDIMHVTDWRFAGFADEEVEADA